MVRHNCIFYACIESRGFQVRHALSLTAISIGSQHDSGYYLVRHALSLAISVSFPNTQIFKHNSRYLLVRHAFSLIAISIGFQNTRNFKLESGYLPVKHALGQFS